MRPVFWRSRRAIVLGLLASPLVAACVYYPEPYPYPTSNPYDRAFNAVQGAMADQGVRITDANQASGTVIGVRGGITVTATVSPQPGGSAKVDLRTRGNTDEDPTLINRITSSYNARMGR
jgi:hypothetical protein